MAPGLRPTTSYIVCMTPRTGSSFLCECLALTGVAGRPAEHFWREDGLDHRARYGVATYADVLDRVLELGSTPNGVFGLKVSTGGGYFASVIELVRHVPEYSGAGRPDPEVMAAAFPGLRYVWLTRRDKVRQAVSWWKAAQTNRWQRYRDEAEPAGQGAAPEFVFEAVDQLVQEAVAREAAWQRYFTEGGIRPLTLVYEDFVRAPEEAVGGVLDFLGVAAPPEPGLERARHVKQADATSEAWAERYRAIKEASWRNKGW
jgi:LPS sulfotransferase NodH